MKLLILGAGATGGYFGGRLTAVGSDVSFLVREGRAAQLAADGLVIDSPFGNQATPVKTVKAGDPLGFHDCVILSCKAYDLESAIRDIAPAVGPGTIILPLLNGIRHLEALDAAFGKPRVLGGSCHLSVTLTDEGHIRHLNQLHLMTFGARHESQLPVCDRLNAVFLPANFDAKLSGDVTQSMWDKWVLLASLAALTCLFRASVGAIAAVPDARTMMLAAIEECRLAAAANGREPAPEHMDLIRRLMTDPASPVVASMLRDMQRGGRIEGEHIVGDLLARGRSKGVSMPVLTVANANLECYRVRLSGQVPGHVAGKT